MPSERRRLTLVAAYADNRVIGDRGRIPWRLPEDFAHFKATTMGGVLVMGRATYDSIGRPLPGRTTIVVTRNPGWSADGVLVAHSLDDALALAADQPGETYVVGGTQVYEQALPLATHQVLTEVTCRPMATRTTRSSTRRVGRDRREPRTASTGCGGSGVARTSEAPPGRRFPTRGHSDALSGPGVPTVSSPSAIRPGRPAGALR